MSADTMSEPLIERPDPEKKLTSIIEAGKGEVDAANRMLAQAAVVAALCVGGMLTGHEWDDFASFVLGVGLLAATASLTETASDSLANSSSDSSFTGATACYIVDGVQVDGCAPTALPRILPLLRAVIAHSEGVPVAMQAAIHSVHLRA